MKVWKLFASLACLSCIDPELSTTQRMSTLRTVFW